MSLPTRATARIPRVPPTPREGRRHDAAGLTLADVVKTTVFLKDIGDFAAMNETYGRYFPKTPPARTTVEVARLPRDVLIEIEAIAAAK